MDVTHLDIVTHLNKEKVYFFAKPNENIDHLIGNKSVRK